MSEELLTWKCDACAEAEGGSGLPCILTSLLQPTVECCPVSGEECEWGVIPTRHAGKELIEALKEILDVMDEEPAKDMLVDALAKYKENTGKDV